MIHLRKNNGKFENRLNYTEIVCMGIKTKDHSDFMNELNLRMILWSTAEAVLRRLIISQKYKIDPMVYCGSGTETSFAEGVPVINTLYGKGIPASFRDNFSTTVPAFEADWKANLDKFKR